MSTLKDLPEDLVIQLIRTKKMSYLELVDFLSSDRDLRWLLYKDSFMTEVENIYGFPHSLPRFMKNVKYVDMEENDLIVEALKVHDNQFVKRAIKDEYNNYMESHFIPIAIDAKNQDGTIFLIETARSFFEKTSSDEEEDEEIFDPSRFIKKVSDNDLDKVFIYILENYDISQKLLKPDRLKIKPTISPKIYKYLMTKSDSYGFKNLITFSNLERPVKTKSIRNYFDVLDYAISYEEQQENETNIGQNETCIVSKEFWVTQDGAYYEAIAELVKKAYDKNIILSDYQNLTCFFMSSPKDFVRYILPLSFEYNDTIIIRKILKIKISLSVDDIIPNLEYLQSSDMSSDISEYFIDNVNDEGFSDIVAWITEIALDTDNEEMLNVITERVENLYEIFYDYATRAVKDYASRHRITNPVILQYYFDVGDPEEIFREYSDNILELLPEIPELINVYLEFLNMEQKETLIENVLEKPDILAEFMKNLDKETIKEFYNNAVRNNDEKKVKILESYL